MKPTLHQPLTFSKTGHRPTNQDALWPNPADEQTRVFVVCDGMGGGDRGDVAGQLLADAIGRYVVACHFPVLDCVHLKTALDGAYEAYTLYMQQHPMVNRMGSTLALLQFHERGATVAHLGDSRVYWIRDGQIRFRTKDHRRVNELVEAGILTAEQARHHPWRNRLSRAVMTRRDSTIQPVAAQPDLTLLTDLRADDYFFVGTDGVFDSVNDQMLATTLAGDEPDEDKLGTLLAQCQQGSRDNYSGYLIRLASVAEGIPVSPFTYQPSSHASV